MIARGPKGVMAVMLTALSELERLGSDAKTETMCLQKKIEGGVVYDRRCRPGFRNLDRV